MEHIINAIKNGPGSIPEGAHYALVWFMPDTGHLMTLTSLEPGESIIAAYSLRTHGEDVMRKAHSTPQVTGGAQHADTPA